MTKSTTNHKAATTSRVATTQNIPTATTLTAMQLLQPVVVVVAFVVGW